MSISCGVVGAIGLGWLSRVSGCEETEAKEAVFERLGMEDKNSNGVVEWDPSKIMNIVERGIELGNQYFPPCIKHYGREGLGVGFGIINREILYRLFFNEEVGYDENHDVDMNQDRKVEVAEAKFRLLNSQRWQTAYPAQNNILAGEDAAKGLSLTEDDKKALARIFSEQLSVAQGHRENPGAYRYRNFFLNLSLMYPDRIYGIALQMSWAGFFADAIKVAESYPLYCNIEARARGINPRRAEIADYRQANQAHLFAKIAYEMDVQGEPCEGVETLFYRAMDVLDGIRDSRISEGNRSMVEMLMAKAGILSSRE